MNALLFKPAQALGWILEADDFFREFPMIFADEVLAWHVLASGLQARFLADRDAERQAKRTTGS